MKISEMNMRDLKIDRNDMNVAQLRELAAELKIAGRSKMKRAELVEAITAAESAENGETNDEAMEYHEDEDGFAYYLPKASDPASYHNPDTKGLPAAFDLTDTKSQRIRTVPVHGYRVEMEQTASRVAQADLSTNESGISRSIPVYKNGRVWELVDHKDGVMFVVKARTLGKLAKAWAHKLGLWADDIRVTREY